MTVTNLLISLTLLFAQADRIEFQLLNSTEESVRIEIPGFRTLVLHPDHPSEFRVHVGQEFYLLQDIDEDKRPERILLFTATPEYSGEVIKVDKLIKSAIQDYEKAHR